MASYKRSFVTAEFHPLCIPLSHTENQNEWYIEGENRL